MSNYELNSDEVILYEGVVSSKEFKGALQLTLTSKKLVLEREKGLIKKERELVHLFLLEEIKCYNGEVQVKQKGESVEIQTISMNIRLDFSGFIEARKFTGKIIDATTGTTLAKRVSGKTKGAFDIVDETLGLDTREAIKGVLEKGIKGTIINGIGKKK